MTFWAIIKIMTLKVKISGATFWQIWKTLGYNLFQHLVTLPRSLKIYLRVYQLECFRVLQRKVSVSLELKSFFYCNLFEEKTNLLVIVFFAPLSFCCEKFVHKKRQHLL